MKLAIAIFVSCAGLGCGSSSLTTATSVPTVEAKPTVTAVPPTAPLSEDDKADITSRVLNAQHAGYTKHDLSGYMKILATNAVLIRGRSDIPDEYDFQLSREQIEASKRLQFGGTPLPGISLIPLEVQVLELSGEVEILWHMLIRAGSMAEHVGERFRLRQIDGQWMVIEIRTWILDSDSSLDEEVDLEEYLVLDLEASQSSGLKRALALTYAGRIAEAYIEIKPLEPQAEASDGDIRVAQYWNARAILARFHGDIDDATISGCNAQATGVVVAPWVKALACDAPPTN